MYRTIIVPLDGSNRSHAALPVASRLAREMGARLELVRVHTDERRDLADDPSWDALFRESEQRYLESLAEAYRPLAGNEVGTALLSLPVVRSLTEFASSRVAPLFVMATRGRTGLRRALLGSTSDGLVRHGETPVLVLRDRPNDEDTPLWKLQDRPFARIVVALDGTGFAEGAVAHALAIARAAVARLHLVRVVGPVMTSGVIDALAMHPASAYGEGLTTRNDLASEYLQGVVDRINAGGGQVEVTTEVALSTDAGSAIIESCRRRAADLVVIATHGRGASRLLVGAVGDRVLRDGPDAILYVRPTGYVPSASLSTIEGAEEPVTAIPVVVH
jgi:nucleotide-binding universal stress UspA family protein